MLALVATSVLLSMHSSNQILISSEKQMLLDSFCVDLVSAKLLVSRNFGKIVKTDYAVQEKIGFQWGRWAFTFCEWRFWSLRLSLGVMGVLDGLNSRNVLVKNWPCIILGSVPSNLSRVITLSSISIRRSGELKEMTMMYENSISNCNSNEDSITSVVRRNMSGVICYPNGVRVTGKIWNVKWKLLCHGHPRPSLAAGTHR